MATRKRSMPEEADKEWEEASCPICMDHPHNAVLLLCTSHDKGCRSYICDTSYRHSNCLDRFKKLSENKLQFPSPPRLSRPLSHSSEALEDPNISEANGIDHHEETSKVNLKCPMCRGYIIGWKVIEEARNYMNLKPRNCSHESCSFVGSYRELRLHARRVHPTARPTDVDPSRQQAWRSLEEQREYDDIVSAIRTAMPGAMVLGDYVIENGDRGGGESSRLMSTLFLFQMFGSMDSISDIRSDGSRALSRHRRSNGSLPRRRFLWGENLLGLQDGNNDHNRGEEDDEAGLDIMSDAAPSNRRRRRRRLM